APAGRRRSPPAGSKTPGDSPPHGSARRAADPPARSRSSTRPRRNRSALPEHRSVLQSRDCRQRRGHRAHGQPSPQSPRKRRSTSSLSWRKESSIILLASRSVVAQLPLAAASRSHLSKVLLRKSPSPTGLP